MATRLYLPGQPIWPMNVITPDAAWNDTANDQVDPWNILCTSSLVPGVGFFSAARAHDNTCALAGTNNVFLCNYVSPPLDGAQTITGTVKGQAHFLENNAAANAMVQLVIRVLAPDLSTVRGTLLAAHSDALSSELATSFTNRKIPLSARSPDTLTSVSAQDGDHIVMEFGVRKTEAGSTSRNYRVRTVCNSTTDLPENETSTAQDNCWIEFSQDLVFKGMPPQTGTMMLMGMG